MSRICLVPQTVILLAASVIPCWCYGQHSGPISFQFSGTLQPIDLTLTNPYSGEVVRFVGDGTQANVNNSSYVGGNNFDSINMTNLADAIFIRDEMDQQVVTNVEVFFAGAGNDLIQMADPLFVLNELTILGSRGDDILWSNINDDVVLGEGGKDHIVGGPGNDRLEGGPGSDYIGGGQGNDILNGGNDRPGFGDNPFEGAGPNELVGGEGEDFYIVSPSIIDDAFNTIRDPDDGDLDRIVLPIGFGLDPNDFEFERIGYDLRISAFGQAMFNDELTNQYLDILIEGQFDTAFSGIDEIHVGRVGTGPVLQESEQLFDLRAMFIPEPTSVVLALGIVLIGTLVRQRC